MSVRDSRQRFMWICSIALLSLLVGQLSVLAGLTGSMASQITFVPVQKTPETEAHPILIDVEALLEVNLTISGLTIGKKLAMGNSGFEHALIFLTTNLGATRLRSEIWFAAPYEKRHIPNDVTGGKFVYPICTSIKASGGCNFNLLFVKKRFLATVNIAGFTLSNLAMYEDVKFPDPTQTYSTTFDAAGNPIHSDNIYNTQTANFRFGDIIEVSGETVSGIRFTGKTGICATEDINRVRKHYAIGKACSVFAPLVFSFETLSIENVVIGNSSWTTSLTMNSQASLSFYLEGRSSLWDLLHVVARYRSQDILYERKPTFVIKASSPFASVKIIDIGADWSPDTIDIFAQATFNADRSPVSVTSQTTFTNGNRLSQQHASVLINYNQIALKTDVKWAGYPSLLWTEAALSMRMRVGDYSFQANALFEPIILAVRYVYARVSLEF